MGLFGPGFIPSPVPRSLFTKRYSRFRLLLVEARKHAGLTQSDLAKRLSRPQSFVSKFERGERRLDVIEFLDIALAIGISAPDVLKKLNETKPREPRRPL